MKISTLFACVLGAGLLFSLKTPKKPITELKDLQKAMKAGYSYIPSGRTVVDGDTVSCQGFFMMKSEVSNFNYLEYLQYIKQNGTASEYQAALPDTAKWKSTYVNLTKFADHYLRHPAFRGYPTVNISYEQAEKFCDWLSMIWQKNTLNTSIKFRLPTKAEFLRAANGTSIERPYAWNGPYLRDGKGIFLANFLTIGAGAISRNPETGKLEVKYPFDTSHFGPESDYADVTAPVESFTTNEFGLYHLNGNISEMIAEKGIAMGGDWNSPGYDIRNQSEKKYTEANPFVGFRPVMTFVGKE